MQHTPFMFSPHYPPTYGLVIKGPRQQTPLESNEVDLKMRQQPKVALVTTEGKEKNRKPVDPPPIIQMTVKALADPQQHYMQSPYLIMIADLWHPDEHKPNPDKPLAGTICSSLHRLKDVDNKDGAFFVFGDISVKVMGEHRLRFSLFDIHKTPDGHGYQYIASIISDKFKVQSGKDFPGMDESTYLSRAFSDQGVRLRLRKEPRHVMGRKRSPNQAFDPQTPYPPPTPNPTSTLSAQFPASSTPYQSSGHYPTAGGYPDHNEASPVKRSRYSAGGAEEDSSPHYVGTLASPPPAAARPGSLAVQSPMGASFPYGNNYGYNGHTNYGLSRGMGYPASHASTVGDMASMGPPITSPVSMRSQYQAPAHNPGGGLQSSFGQRTTPLLTNTSPMGEFQEDPSFGIASYHHAEHQTDGNSAAGGHVDYASHSESSRISLPIHSSAPNDYAHSTESIRGGLPVQSPHQSMQLPRSDFSFQAQLQPSPVFNSNNNNNNNNPYSGRNNTGGMQSGGGSWSMGMPRYEESVDRGRRNFQLTPLHHHQMGGGGGGGSGGVAAAAADGHHHHSSSQQQHSSGYDDQFKHEHESQ